MWKHFGQVWYWSRKSITADGVSRFQCLFPNLELVGVEGHPVAKHLFQYPWVDNWLIVIFPVVSPEVWLSTLEESDVFKINEEDDEEWGWLGVVLQRYGGGRGEMCGRHGGKCVKNDMKLLGLQPEWAIFSIMWGTWYDANIYPWLSMEERVIFKINDNGDDDDNVSNASKTRSYTADAVWYLQPSGQPTNTVMLNLNKFIIIIIISLTSIFFQDKSRVWTAASQQH